MEPIKVLIADDHQLVREGIRAMIEGEEGITVVAEAGNGAEALALAQELAPTLVLMDIRMPTMDGLEATRRLKEISPSILVVMLSLYDSDSYVVDAIRAGAVGYILKDATRDLLVHTIKAVSAGGVLLGPNLLCRALGAQASPGTPGRVAGSSLSPDTLSNREMDVLRLVVEGLTNKQIAARLSLAGDTVKKHVQNLIAKLQATDRTQAAVKAIRTGLVSETAWETSQPSPWQMGPKPPVAGPYRPETGRA